jgi:hypothetical protein
MATASESDFQLEIGHVLLIDIVGYSKLLITEQREELQALNEIVRNTAQFQASDAKGMLVRVPTGDGMALIFRDTVEAPCGSSASAQLCIRSMFRARNYLLYAAYTNRPRSYVAH